MSDDDGLAEDCDKLETIKVFDVVSDRFKMGGNVGLLPTTIDNQISKTTTPISLLVESLVKQLCAMLEKDPTRSQKLYLEICQHLHKMNLIDESYAYTEFEMIRSQYQNALYQLVAVSREQNMPAALETEWPLAQPVGYEWSRYHREFEELDFIAEGGFGKVYKARHRLDGNEYAIKKVIIKADSIQKIFSHFTEVKTLASLSHVNIVPYKTAWLEPLMVGMPAESSGLPQPPASRTEEEEESSSSDSHSKKTGAKRLTDDEDSSLRLPAAKHDTTGGSSIEFVRSSQDDDIFYLSMSSQESMQDNAIQPYQQCEAKPHIKLKWAVLYIQMTMCQLTLRRFLDNRNATSDLDAFYRGLLGQNLSAADHLDICLKIFLQLCNGLEYCHSRGIVHHDLKPSNIFIHIDLDGNYLIQLGDFGLACPLRISHAAIRIGTPLYAAPEQLGGLCDPKSDVYSAGVILLELLKPMKTDMERQKTVELAQNGVVPDLPPALNQLLRRLLSPVSSRPTVSDVKTAIKSILSCSPPAEDTSCSSVIKDLERQLSEQNEQIERLRLQISASLPNIPAGDSHQVEIEAKEREIADRQQEVRSKDEEIEKLKRRILQLESQNGLLKSKEEEVQRLKLMIEEILNLNR